MAFKRLNDLKLIEEYCCKPVNETCPIHKTCYDNEFAGEKAEDLPVKCVALRFEGKEALKSIDIMIEDLQKIRENLSKECEVESEHI